MKKCGGSDQEALPQEIIQDILLRLPAKSLLRFRSVSKLWLSIISDPQFISSFFIRSSPHSKLFLSFPQRFGSERVFYSLAYSECLTGKMSQDHRPLSLTSHGLIRPPPLPSSKRVSHYSAGGLVCTDYYEWGTLVVCNPSTREAITLKDLPYPFQLYINHFGFDPVENKYKILSILNYEGDRFSAWVITLGEENWRDVNGGYPACSVAGVCINGVIYYLSPTQSTNSYRLIAFDVRLETFKQIPLPAACEDFGAFLMESDGCVALANRIDDDTIRLVGEYYPDDDDVEISDYQYEEIPMYTLKEVPNQIWKSESFPVPRNLIKLIQRVAVFPVGTSHKGELLYATNIHWGKFKLYVCNLRDSSVREIEVDGLPKDLELIAEELRVCSHVENLVSLKGFSTACWRY